MMKKLLISMLVLGLASSANAALTLVSSAGDTLDPTGVAYPSVTMIGIYNDTALPGQDLITYPIIQAYDLGHWTGVSHIIPPPDGENIYLGVVDLHTGYGLADTWYSTIFSPDPFPVGILTDFEFECLGEGEVVIRLLDQSGATEIDSLTITQIPEPMTIALLGLGGLFLLRRRK